MSNLSKASNDSSKTLSRKHVVEDMGNGLVSLLGGKWTSYRAMASHCVDEILSNYKSKFPDVNHESCQTLGFKLAGAYTRMELDKLITLTPDQWMKRYEDHFVYLYELPRASAQHLVKNYGTQSLRIVEFGT